LQGKKDEKSKVKREGKGRKGKKRKSSDTTLAIVRLQQCITDINRWMSANRLKLNMDKTELLWAGTRHALSQKSDCFPSLQLADDTVHPSQHVRVLGVVFSADLSLEKHVTKVSATCFYQLRQLRHVRRTLTIRSLL